MNRPVRAAYLAVATAALLLAATGCTGGENPVVTASPSPSHHAAEMPSAEPQEAPDLSAERDELHAQARGLLEGDGVIVDTSLEFEGSTQQSSFVADPASRSFEGTLVTRAAGAEVTLEIVRVRKLTWIRAPKEYWVGAGYDAESADAAVGLFVPFEPQAGNALAEAYDPMVLLDHVAESEVEAAAESSYQLPDGVTVTLTSDGMHVHSVVDEGVVDVTYVRSAEKVVIDMPAREETLAAD